jgi:hypothetical protein
MKVIVTSGKYPEILPLFAHQFNKYFGSDFEVIVLSSREVTGLPDNFSYVKIPFTEYWCNDVREFFDTFEDEIFLGCMEDHFLHSKVDPEFLAEIIDAFDDPSVIKYCSVKPGDENSAVRDRPVEPYQSFSDTLLYNAPVRQSLLPSVWRTSFFKLILENSIDYNAWQFEARDNHYKLEPVIADAIADKKVLFSAKQLYAMSDVIRGGRPGVDYWSQEVHDPEDIQVFKDATVKVFPNVLWTA